jgi:SAM-dependent methyltransferase
MQHSDWFEDWFGSPYYKVLYQNRDELEAQLFVKSLITYLQPMPGSRMLDIACGEGRYAVQLVGYGYDVVGIDLSEPSIEIAKKQENEYLQFYVHDMRKPFYSNYFDFAFNFFTSFGYFKTERDHQLAVNTFAQALKPGGLLVIDYFNKDYVINKLIAEDTIERGGYTFHINKKLENKYIIKEISFNNEHGKALQFTEQVAAFDLSDFVKMFKEAKLSLVGTFGDYQLNEYNPLHSPRMIMIFKK